MWRARTRPGLRHGVAALGGVLMVASVGVVAGAAPLHAYRSARIVAHPLQEAHRTVLRQTPVDQLAADILDLVNTTRGAAGRSILAWDPHLASIARRWSTTMAMTESLHHSDLEATIHDPQSARYRYLGENILVAPGSLTANAVHRAWMASPRHAENVLDPDFDTLGIGIVRDRSGRLWATETFGGLG